MRLTQVLRCVSKLPKDFHNFPERFVKRANEQVEYETPKGRQYRRTAIKKPQHFIQYTMDRPWTNEFHSYNDPGSKKPWIPVDPIPLTYFRGDRVEILVGRDKGKQGIVNYVVRERNWVCVEGLNMEYKERDTGGILSKMTINGEEKPLLMNKQVALVDPVDEKPTKVEWRYTEGGEQVRVSLRTGRTIPIPIQAEETIDYKTKATYKDQPKDTASDDLITISFMPKLSTFEMDIMEEYGIKDDRVPQRTFWY